MEKNNINCKAFLKQEKIIIQSFLLQKSVLFFLKRLGCFHNYFSKHFEKKFFIFPPLK
jgi:hypothetical protein